MHTLLLVLRVIHILCGTFWAGTTIFLVVFCEPTANALGPDGGKFMRHLTGNTLFPVAMSATGSLTVLAGLALFFVSSGSSLSWFTSVHGLVLASAAALGIVAAVIGAGVLKGTLKKLEALAGQINATQAQPSAQQEKQLFALKQRFSRFARINAVLLTTCVIGMSIARYL